MVNMRNVCVKRIVYIILKEHTLSSMHTHIYLNPHTQNGAARQPPQLSPNPGAGGHSSFHKKSIQLFAKSQRAQISQHLHTHKHTPKRTFSCNSSDWRARARARANQMNNICRLQNILYNIYTHNMRSESFTQHGRAYTTTHHICEAYLLYEVLLSIPLCVGRRQVRCQILSSSTTRVRLDTRLRLDTYADSIKRE